MPIINRGSYTLSEAVRRQVDTDWPTANIDFDLYVHDLFASGNVVTTGITSNVVTANSFASSGTGTPTIVSSTNINLSANGVNGGAVVIQNSALRLRSYTDGDVANLTASAGDIVFNSSVNKAQLYDGTNWSNVGAGISTGDQNYTGNLIPDLSNTYNLGSPDNRWKDLYLSGNTIYLGDVQLSSANNKLVVNSIEANILVTSNPTLYSAGRGITISTGGVITTTADDSDQYDIGIDKQITYFPTDSMENAFTIPATEGYRYLIQSFVVTNISESEATFDCDIQYLGNTFTYANNFVLPFGYSIDLIDKPEIFLPNTIVSMKAAANNTLSTYVIYKTVDDISYDSQFSNVAQSNTFYTIYTASQASSIVENIKVINESNTLLRGTVLLADSNNTIKAYIAANTLLAKQYYTDVIMRPLRLELGDNIQFAGFNAEYDALTTFVTARLGEVYNVTPNVTTVNEGGTVRFAITTLNIPSYTIRYYRTSGNVSTSDFVGGNIGSFLIVDGAANVLLTLSEDSSYDENDEIFRLQILTGSAQGQILKESEDIVLVKDSSNVAVLQTVNVTSNLIYESESAIFTLNTINGEGNAAAIFYYTVTGNADIIGNTSGEIIINDNIANLEIIAEANVPDGETREFAVQFRRNSVSGTILQTSGNILVYSDGTPQGMVVTGGTAFTIEI